MSHRAREHVWALKQIGAHIPEEMKKQVAPKRPPVVVAITPTRVSVIRRRDGACFIQWTALGPLFGSPAAADRFDSPDAAFELARAFPWVKTEIVTRTLDELRADANDWLAKQ